MKATASASATAARSDPPPRPEAAFRARRPMRIVQNPHGTDSTMVTVRGGEPKQPAAPQSHRRGTRLLIAPAGPALLRLPFAWVALYMRSTPFSRDLIVEAGRSEWWMENHGAGWLSMTPSVKSDALENFPCRARTSSHFCCMSIGRDCKRQFSPLTGSPSPTR